MIDPIADKALIGTAFVTMTWVGLLPLPLAGIVLLRDAGLMVAAFGLRYQSLKPHVGGRVTWQQYWDFSVPSATVTPTAISKFNTFVQIVAVYCSLAAPVYGIGDHAALYALWYVHTLKRGRNKRGEGEVARLGGLLNENCPLPSDNSCFPLHFFLVLMRERWLTGATTVASGASYVFSKDAVVFIKPKIR